MKADTPSPEGERRYPETMGFMVELKEPIPCTCKATCHPLCTGECGCDACSVMFSMFCDEAGCFPQTETEMEQAIIRYRGEL